MSLTVSEVAALAGITVRALHHYDEIGLVRPSGRTGAGYRLYDTASVERLQEVLTYRALDFSLDEIAKIVDDPDYDRVAALRHQHQMLTSRAEQTTRLIEALERAMSAQERGVNLTDEELLEVFGADFGGMHDEYEAEAKQEWGETDAWAESRKRTKDLTKQEWVVVKAEGDATMLALADALRSGAAADSDNARDAAEAARLHIDRRFYPCSHEMHSGLGEMYVADERFAKTYNDLEPGLAQYVRDAIVANGRRHA